ncbi:adhesin [Rodentibacter ratti]|uniref:Adhesin n=2 Tax=Rodentibacter TaxID=1960084 RepID=A0A1V3KYX8_9PAST|nr:adhesin [Rodentibacter heylii]OOF82874.1 adhesin [Rodentibacter ratti]
MSADGKTAFSANNASDEGSAKAEGRNSTALGYGSEATAENTIAIGVSSKATAENASALGQNAKAVKEKSVALGQNSQAIAENSVALGTDSVADEKNTVSVGSRGNERRITNVAQGIKGTDAVNMSQLNQVKGEVESVRKDLRKTDKKLRGGIAGATAIANIPQATKAGANVVGVGVGNYNGQSSVAVGYSKLSDNNKVIFKFSGAATTQGDFNIGAGVGYQW